MDECNIKLCSLLSTVSMHQMTKLNRLQALAACTLINKDIPILPFSIPTHLFEDLRTLNTIKLLREEEKFLQQKHIVLQINLYNTIEKENEYKTLYEDASVWDQDLSLELFCKYDDYKKLEKRINMLIVETENRLSERDMEEELYLSRLQ